MLQPKDFLPGLTGAFIALVATNGQTPLESVAMGAAAGTCIQLFYDALTVPVYKEVNELQFQQGYLGLVNPKNWGNPDTHVANQAFSTRQLAPGVVQVDTMNTTFITDQPVIDRLMERRNLGR